MAVADWNLLQQQDEDALHGLSRLLTIEWRPYNYVSSRLLKADTVDTTRPLQLPSPPPDASAADEEAAARAVERDNRAAEAVAWEEENTNYADLLHFANLRLEFNIHSNFTERERFADDKDAIILKQQAVRDNMEELRDELKEAIENLALKKEYDVASEKTFANKMLKPRKEQAAAHEKLDDEIAELEQEVKRAKETWAERRKQFGRIQQEAREMLRMIKDEKEEAERKEGMMKDGDYNEEGEGGNTRGGQSQVGTPRPDGGEATPMHVSQTEDGSQALQVPQDRLAPQSRSNSVAPSLARSEHEDAEMADSGKDAPAEDSSGIEEGEEEEDEGEMDES